MQSALKKVFLPINTDDMAKFFKFFLKIRDYAVNKQ